MSYAPWPADAAVFLMVAAAGWLVCEAIWRALERRRIRRRLNWRP